MRKRIRKPAAFEERFIKSPLGISLGCTEATHHAEKVAYTVDHIYTPDFTVRHPKSALHYELKGFFKCDPSKYEWVRKVLQKREMLEEIVLVFQNGNTYMPKSRKRKDGTRQTMNEWAEKHNFKFIDCKGLI
jgi:hypothetical protein